MSCQQLIYYADMNIVFMGTPKLAACALEGLYDSKHKILAVVTQPDRESGRGRQIVYSPVKEFAVEKGLKILQPEKISDEEVLSKLEELNADLFVVVAYAQKIPERLLNMAPYGCINVHPSMLPKYRGAAPLRGPILNGDPVFGISIMRLCDKWDAGDVLLQKEYPVEKKDTTESLELRVRELAAPLLLETMEGLENGSITPEAQDDDNATYIKQISKEEGLIDFSDTAEQIERQIRACIPWPSAYTYLEGKLFKIWDADVLSEEEMKTYLQESDYHTGTGCVAFADKENIYIKCGSGYLKLNDVQIEGKKRMSAADFLKGKKIERGTAFGK